jgi:aspartyl-tRNA synthetase
MSRTLVRDLRSQIEQTVTVKGWVSTLRSQRTMQFLILRDPTGLVQVTHKRGGEGDDLELAIESLTDESAVAVTGRVVDNAAVKLHGLEIFPEHVEILGRAETPLPIDSNSGLEHAPGCSSCVRCPDDC